MKAKLLLGDEPLHIYTRVGESKSLALLHYWRYGEVTVYYSFGIHNSLQQVKDNRMAHYMQC
jgi:hypothetical protein